MDVLWPDGKIYVGRWREDESGRRVEYNDKWVDELGARGPGGQYRDEGGTGDPRVVYKRSYVTSGNNALYSSVLWDELEDGYYEDWPEECVQRALAGLSAKDTYKYSWDEVPETEKDKALARALDDYTEFGCWDPKGNDDITEKEVGDNVV